MNKTTKATARKLHFTPQHILTSIIGIVVFIGLLVMQTQAHALTYNIPTNGDNVVGEAFIAQSRSGDSLATVGWRYDIGIREMMRANPNLPDNRILRPGTKVVIPQRFILPPGPRQGIVVNLAEYRLYYYPGNGKVMTYPVGIGKVGWETPTFSGYIVKTAYKPVWNVPKSVKEYNLSRGIKLPNVMQPGPDNPLGKYALYTSNSGYLIHGTTQPLGVGGRVSSGCLRLYPKDIKQLYQYVKNTNTSVRVIHEPYKVGRLNGLVYLEAHPALGEYQHIYYKSMTPLMSTIMRDTNTSKNGINWNIVNFVVTKSYGIPQKISR